MWTSLKQFYNSKAWTDFRKIIIAERNNICEECGKFILESKHITIHHIKELTLENVNDYNISLSEDNVKVVCHKCHNDIHERFGARKVKERGIYIVYGAPCSGKTTYVLDNKNNDDLVIDMDSLYEAITLLPRYNKPDKLKYNIFAMRNLLIDNVKTRYGNFNSAWIIGGYPKKYDREKLARDLGAELIYIKADKAECLERLKNCNDYRQINRAEWEKYINEWFNTFVE
jgi:hypothetical protein